MQNKALQLLAQLCIFFNIMGNVTLCGMDASPDFFGKQLLMFFGARQPYHPSEHASYYSNEDLNSKWFKLGVKHFIQLTLSNNIAKPNSPQLGQFWGRWPIAIPTLSPLDYLNRLQTHLYCPHACYVFALIYISRLINKNQNTTIFNRISFYRVFLTAILLAIKWSDDHSPENKYYAKIGGIPTVELNDLEIIFLQNIDFNVSIWLEEWNYAISVIRQLGEEAESKLEENATKEVVVTEVHIEEDSDDDDWYEIYKGQTISPEDWDEIMGHSS